MKCMMIVNSSVGSMENMVVNSFVAGAEEIRIDD